MQKRQSRRVRQSLTPQRFPLSNTAELGTMILTHELLGGTNHSKQILGLLFFFIYSEHIFIMYEFNNKCLHFY